MPTPDIRSLVDDFVAQLEEHIRQEALEAVHEALGSQAAPKRGPGRPRKSAASKAATKPKVATTTKGGKRVRRSPEAIQAAQDAILAIVKESPGIRAEEIRKSLGVAAKDIKRPIDLLMEAGKLRTEGKKRGTKYFAGAGGQAKVAVKRKAGGRKAPARKKAVKRGRG